MDIDRFPETVLIRECDDIIQTAFGKYVSDVVDAHALDEEAGPADLCHRQCRRACI